MLTASTRPKKKRIKYKKLTAKAKEKLFKQNNKANWKKRSDFKLSICSPNHKQ